MNINKKYLEKIIMINILVIIGLLFYFNINKQQIENFNSNSNLLLIIPIRNREEHLKELLPKITNIFKYQDIDYRVIIVEQSDKKKFNKGKINNVAFIEGSKLYPTHNNILFNDVDNYPFYNKTINYKEINLDKVRHYFGFTHCLGGMFMIHSKHFNKINGFSNEFWGWGGEDTDLQNRCEIKNIEIDRKNFIKRDDNKKLNIFNDDITETKVKDAANQKNQKLKRDNLLKYKNNKESLLNDGINNCEYKILKKTKVARNIIRILVDI